MKEEGPALPQELFDLILDHLWDDLETLSSCALVSSNFLPSSRAHIFSHIRVGPLDRESLRLGPLDGEHAIDDLYGMLAGLPSLAARVESLHLWDNIMRRHSWIEAFPYTSTSSMVQLSSLLVSLSRLSITIESGFVHWANISDAVRASIPLTLALPTLTCVELTGLYGVPFTILAHCPALRAVTLKWVTFDERDNHDFSATLAACASSPPTQLEHLDLDLDTRVLVLLSRWILLPESPLDITRLHSLTCTVDRAGFDHLRIQRLLNACAPSLQRLRLKNVSGTFDLHECAQLKTLTFDVGHPIELRVRWLADNVVFPPPTTQALGLVFRLTTRSARPEIVQLDLADPAFAQLPPSITNVTVVLDPADGAEVKERDLVDVSAEFVERLPLLRARLAGGGALRVLRSP
ncbi:hypothetical protein B0H11DRAFT_13225 [Mycena galericulata]|nr:hypothetical protein B0H11DRAFT_13225 [Mycena galericulata]